jgi:hypothetical protein
MADPTDWHRRQALQIAAQLPEETEDARLVLKYVEDLIGFFWPQPDPPAPPPAGDGDQAVVRFPGGSSSPSRRASSSGRPLDLPK